MSDRRRRAGGRGRRRMIAAVSTISAFAVCVAAAAVLLAVRAGSGRTDAKLALPTAPPSASQNAAGGGPGFAPDDIVADPTPAPRSQPAPGQVAVPVLMYHFIRVSPSAGDRLGYQLSVTPDNFAKQMQTLHDAGAHTISLAEVMSALTQGTALPTRPVVLTFDDGFKDFATDALPVLQRNGFTATAFIVSGFVGRPPQYMDDGQIQQISDAGITIGAHTIHHVDLTHTDAVTAAQEIEVSRRTLQALTGQQVLDFAYPAGAHSPSTERMVQAAGFRDAVSTDPGAAQTAADRFHLLRQRIQGDDTLATFALKAGVPVSPSVTGDTAAPAPPVPVSGGGSPCPPGASAAARRRCGG